MGNSVPCLRVVILPLLFLASGCAVQPPENPSRAEPNSSTAETLTVGPGQAYALPSAAARAAKAGDTIRIFPGTYSDCARWAADGLVVEGAGDDVTITDKICDGKALFVTTGRDITIRNITFTSAHAADHNGAGIRAEGANLTVENSRFIANDEGILADDNPAGTIVIRNSLFKGNGNCIAACAHGLYVGHIALLRVQNCEFSDQHTGHHIKSRAARTEITGNAISDGPLGSASYLIDLPDGGAAVITGNRFEKGPNTQNKQVAIAIGAEKDKPPNPDGPILVENNIFANDTGVPTTFVRNFAGASVTVRDNTFHGDVTAFDGAPISGEQ